MPEFPMNSVFRSSNFANRFLFVDASHTLLLLFHLSGFLELQANVSSLL